MMIGLLVFAARLLHQKPADADAYIRRIMDLECCVKDNADSAKHTHTVKDMLTLKNRSLITHVNRIKDRRVAEPVASRMDNRVIEASGVLVSCTSRLVMEKAGLVPDLSEYLAAFSGGLYDFLHVKSRSV